LGCFLSENWPSALGRPIVPSTATQHGACRAASPHARPPSVIPSGEVFTPPTWVGGPSNTPTKQRNPTSTARPWCKEETFAGPSYSVGAGLLSPRPCDLLCRRCLLSHRRLQLLARSWEASPSAACVAPVLWGCSPTIYFSRREVKSLAQPNATYATPSVAVCLPQTVAWLGRAGQRLVVAVPLC